MSECGNCKKQAEEIERLRKWHERRNSYVEHPAQDLSQWRAYDRMPFQIGVSTVVMLTLFQHDGHLNDIWLHEHVDLQRQQFDGLYDRAAEQFKKQTEGHTCMAFWKAMKAMIDKEISDWEMAKKQRG